MCSAAYLTTLSSISSRFLILFLHFFLIRFVVLLLSASRCLKQLTRRRPTLRIHCGLTDACRQCLCSGRRALCAFCGLRLRREF
jgi:hypothetical protein